MTDGKKEEGFGEALVHLGQGCMGCGCLMTLAPFIFILVLGLIGTLLNLIGL